MLWATMQPKKVCNITVDSFGLKHSSQNLMKSNELEKGMFGSLSFHLWRSSQLCKICCWRWFRVKHLRLCTMLRSSIRLVKEIQLATCIRSCVWSWVPRIHPPLSICITITNWTYSIQQSDTVYASFWLSCKEFGFCTCVFYSAMLRIGSLINYIMQNSIIIYW